MFATQKRRGSIYLDKYFIAISLVLAAGCAPGRDPAIPEPEIRVEPVRESMGPWQIVDSDVLSVRVSAPGASAVRILFRPVAASSGQLALKSLSQSANGSFTADLPVVADFAGELWAEVHYPDGALGRTQGLQVAARDAISVETADLNVKSNDESARSDRQTGGEVPRATFEAGNTNLTITVNVPAFQLTLWQDGKEVSVYDIGVGLKKFPIAIGERQATSIIWNPAWIPPESEWVLESTRVQPGERIEPDDPRNPLGKVKIPLGNGYLIHQAADPSDIGSLVSHGCIRMLQEDIYDLAEKIVAARAPGFPKDRIEQAKRSDERLVIELEPSLPVDINYDTEVVEGGLLHLYPDIYGRNSDRMRRLKTELVSVGVDLSAVGERELREILDRVAPKLEFVVSVADLAAGRGLMTGETRSLVSAGTLPEKSKR